MVEAGALPRQPQILITSLLMESKRLSLTHYFSSPSRSISQSLFVSTWYSVCKITFSELLHDGLFVLFSPKTEHLLTWHTWGEAACSSQRKSLPLLKCYITGIPRFRGYVSAKCASYCLTHPPVVDINVLSAQKLHTYIVYMHKLSDKQGYFLSPFYLILSLFICVTLCAYSIVFP